MKTCSLLLWDLGRESAACLARLFPNTAGGTVRHQKARASTQYGRGQAKAQMEKKTKLYSRKTDRITGKM